VNDATPVLHRISGVTDPAPSKAVLGEKILSLIGMPQYVSEAGIAANDINTRGMCAAVENRNSVYWDEAVAREILGEAYCPATMLAAWGRPELWEPGRDKALKALQCHFDLKDLLGFSASMAVSYTITFYEPVAIGDRLKTQQVVKAIGDLKTTKLGQGRFWTIEMQYLSENSDLVGIESYEFFGFEKDRT